MLVLRADPLERLDERLVRMRAEKDVFVADDVRGNGADAAQRVGRIPHAQAGLALDNRIDVVFGGVHRDYPILPPVTALPLLGDTPPYAVQQHSPARGRIDAYAFALLLSDPLTMA